MKKVKISESEILAAKISDSNELKLIEIEAEAKAALAQQMLIIDEYGSKLEDLVFAKYQQLESLENKLINLIEKEKSFKQPAKKSFNFFKKQVQPKIKDFSKHEKRLSAITDMKNMMKEGSPFVELLARQKLTFINPDLSKEYELARIEEQKARETLLKLNKKSKSLSNSFTRTLTN